MAIRFSSIVLAVLCLCPGLSRAAHDATVYGGDVHFMGQVVSPACTVSADSLHQVVRMRQVRSNAFHGIGDWADPVPFQIHLEGCSDAVSSNAGILFGGVTDGKDPQVFRLTETDSPAHGVGIGIFDAAGNQIIPNTAPQWLTSPLPDNNMLSYSARYRATDRQILSGNANADVWFSMVYQ